MKNLFGETVTAKPKTTVPRGYAAPPGTGPEGESCGSCTHAQPMRAGNKKFYKCAKAQWKWTHGVGSDIRLKAPACREWERPWWRR